MFDVSFMSQTNLQFDLRGRSTPLNLISSTGTSSGGGKTNLIQDYTNIGSAIAKSVDAGNSSYTSIQGGITEFKKFANTGAQNPGYNYPNPLPFILDAIPGIAGAASGANFLITALTGKPEDDNRHLIYDLDMKAYGKMKTEDPYSPIDFPMPSGNNMNQIVPPTRLMYNNIMGIANVITTPTVYYYNKTINSSEYATYFRLKD